MILSIVVLLFAAIVVLGAIGFLVLDAMDKVESIQKRAPWITKILERRSALVALLMICVVLLIGDGYELLTKEMPEVSAAPSVTFSSPAGPRLTVYQLVPPFNEPDDSLRRRTIKLSNEIDHWVEGRWANRPPIAYPDPKNPNPSVDQQKAIETWLKWDQESYNYFGDHFKDQWIQTVKEYDAKGVKVGTLINDAEQNHPVQRLSFPFPPVPEDSMCMQAQTRFRELAYHVDAKDKRVDIIP
ncbi:MAG: hypothetical protein WAN65_01885 [Candidatus Sulfotelmatobacter sp.]